MLTDNSIDLSVQCPFCAGTRLKKFRATAADLPTKSSINIVECQNCDVAWQWPLQRSEVESIAYFEGEYDNKSGYFDAVETANRSALQLEFVNSCAPVGRLLDIGSGSGAFIKVAAMASWECIGLEPAGVPFEEGRAKLVRGGIEDLRSSEMFDVATLFDVVEHVPDYVSLLRAVSTHVKVGGSIVIETGNYQSLDRLRSGPNWWDFQGDHRWYLAPNIVCRQLSDLGFDGFRLCERVLRQQWKGRGEQPPLLHEILLGTFRRPWRAAQKIAQYRSERAAAAKWRSWYHVAIFTLAAVKRY